MKDIIYKYINESIMLTSEKFINKVLYVSDNQYIRMIKLNRILNKNSNIKHDFKKGEIMIEQDMCNKKLYINRKIYDDIKNKYKLQTKNSCIYQLLIILSNY